MQHDLLSINFYFSNFMDHIWVNGLFFSGKLQNKKMFFFPKYLLLLYFALRKGRELKFDIMTENCFHTSYPYICFYLLILFGFSSAVAIRSNSWYSCMQHWRQYPGHACNNNNSSAQDITSPLSDTVSPQQTPVTLKSLNKSCSDMYSQLIAIN